MRASPTERLASLLIDSLATYRLVKLVRHDRITEPMCAAVVENHGPPERSKVSYLIDCPWCLSFYFGAALTVGRLRWPRATEAMARTFAVSALTSVASGFIED
jgi:hypothetical protein